MWIRMKIILLRNLDINVNVLILVFLPQMKEWFFTDLQGLKDTEEKEKNQNVC